MSTTAIAKGLRMLELLATESVGLTVSEAAARLGLARVAAQRVFRSLEARGFVRFHAESKRFALTMKLAKLGMSYVARSGMSDVYQPILDRLAADTGELVRMTLAEGDRLTWVGMAQGSRSGLRIAPDTGRDVCLHATAAGKAWLASMPLERAVKLVLDRGFGRAEDLGPNAIANVESLLAEIKATARQGHGISMDEYIPGMAAIAAAIPGSGAHDAVLGTLSIAGPTARMTRAQLRALVPLLLAGTAELSALAPIIAAQSAS